jgi:hypothetical protein
MKFGSQLDIDQRGLPALDAFPFPRRLKEHVSGATQISPLEAPKTRVHSHVRPRTSHLDRKHHANSGPHWSGALAANPGHASLVSWVYGEWTVPETAAPQGVLSPPPIYGGQLPIPTGTPGPQSEYRAPLCETWAGLFMNESASGPLIGLVAGVASIPSVYEFEYNLMRPTAFISLVGYPDNQNYTIFLDDILPTSRGDYVGFGIYQTFLGLIRVQDGPGKNDYYELDPSLVMVLVSNYTQDYWFMLPIFLNSSLFFSAGWGVSHGIPQLGINELSQLARYGQVVFENAVYGTVGKAGVGDPEKDPILPKPFGVGRANTHNLSENGQVVSRASILGSIMLRCLYVGPSHHALHVDEL